MNVKKFREDSDAAFWAREGMREIQVSFVNSHQMHGTCLLKDKKKSAEWLKDGFP